MEARAAAFASPEADAAFRAFGRKVTEFHADCWLYRELRNRPNADWTDARRTMDSRRDDARDLLAELERIVREELAAA
jgi:hypothetical protein